MINNTDLFQLIEVFILLTILLTMVMTYTSHIFFRVCFFKMNGILHFDEFLFMNM